MEKYRKPAGWKQAMGNDLTEQLMQALAQWSLAPVVDCLVALRGIDKLAAMVLLAELGDISRFDSPRQLMAYLGWCPANTAVVRGDDKGGLLWRVTPMPGVC